MNLRIKEIAKAKKISITALASMVGITQPNMNNIANGKSEPSLKTLEKISDALSVDITELFESNKSSLVKCPNCGHEIEIELTIK